MDEIDKKILRQLQQNAKQNTKEIADKVGLSVSPTYERIKKLEQQGFIVRYMAILDADKIGKTVKVYCHISLSNHARELIDNFKTTIKDFPEIVACHHVSGNYDFLLRIAVRDMNEYQRFLIDRLSIIPGISSVQSTFVLEEVKGDMGYSL